MTQTRRPEPAARKTAAASPAPAVELKPHNGALTLFIAGRAAVPIGGDILPNTTAAQIESLAAAGCHFYRLRNVDLGWTSGSKSDFAALDARLKTLLSADPAARFLLEIAVDPPQWWREKNAGEFAAYCIPLPENAAPPVSFASKRWRTDAGNALISLVQYIENGDAGKACLGYQIAAGAAGEWRYSHPDRLPDIGVRMTEHFRAFALEKYRRNEGLLRKAWFDAKADFRGIVCPGERDRRRADKGIFRNPARARKILDYYEAFADAQNAASLHFCETAKRAGGETKLVGLSYVPLVGVEAIPEAGHLYPDTVLDSPFVDFVANTGSTDGSLMRVPTGSLRLRDKFFFHAPAPDTAPHLAAALAQTHNAGLFLPADTAPETLKTILAAGDTAVHAPGGMRKRVSTLAVVVDPASSLIVNPKEEWLNTALLSGQLHEIGLVGAPYDVYLLSDLFHPKMPDNKIYLFANTFYLSEAERRRVDAKVKRSEQTAIWAWGSGLVGEEGVDAIYGQRMYSQKTRLEFDASNVRLRIADSNDPLTWGQHVGTQFGTDKPLIPTVTIADKTITRLGANSSNKTAFSALRFETWTSLYIGAVPIPTTLIRNALRAAGCHLYCEADALIYADVRSVAVGSARGGTLKLSLPGLHDVREAWTQKPIASNVSDFNAALAPNATAYYELKRLETRKAHDEKTNKPR